MAQQEKVLACGPSLAALGLVLKFALGPAAMAVGSIAAGLRGDVLRVAIIQVPTTSSLPPSDRLTRPVHLCFLRLQITSVD